MEHRSRLTRRHALAVAGVAIGLAGCQAPADVTPVAIPPEARCDRCGMQIHAHPGPTAQVFFPAEAPHGREGPAWFDSTWEAYQYVYEQEQEPVAWFVTDYSAVEPAVTVDDGVHTIAREVHAQSFRAAEAVSLVADSRVVGAMGRDLIGFGERDDAVAFQRAHGGAVTTHGAVTPALIGLLGR